MKEVFEKQSNGHTLKIIIDKDELFKTVNDAIREVNEEAEGDTAYSIYKIHTADYMNDKEALVKDVILDLERIKRKIYECANSDNSSKLFDDMALKKNGTFKRTCKNTIACQQYGPYYEDCYGWNILELRIKPTSDTEAVMELEHIIEHY